MEKLFIICAEDRPYDYVERTVIAQNEEHAKRLAQFHFTGYTLKSIRGANANEAMFFIANELKRLREIMQRDYPGNSFIEHAEDALGQAIYNLEDFLK